MYINPDFIQANLGLVGRVLGRINCPRHIDRGDLYQEGVLALYDAAEHYVPDRGVAFSTFAYVCVRNRMLNYMKKDRCFVSLEDFSDTIGAESAINESVIDVGIALSMLPEQEQKVIKLLYYEDYTLVEAGKWLNCSHTKVARIRDRAFGRIKKIV